MGKVTVEIKGYRQLSAEDQARINAIKELAEQVGRVVRDERKVGPVNDQRWVSIAETHLQQGFMALIRAIAQPETF